jgi:hypothetical protein
MSEDQNLSIYNHFISNFGASVKNLSHILRYAANSTLYNHINPLNKFGGKVYSQNEEDGITFEILRRIGKLEGGVFAEFGVGNGTENNTLALAALGWKGQWVGNQDLAFNWSPKNQSETNFIYQKAWVNKDNIYQLFLNGMKVIQQDKCTVLSLDLDGNDYHFINELLVKGVSPDLFVVEYNAKFIPPIQFVIDYNENHNWALDDYFGASLSAFADIFNCHGYFLACCNITGSNAFFVKEKFKELFSDIPESIELIYSSPKYFLSGFDVAGHTLSIKTIENIFSKINR